MFLRAKVTEKHGRAQKDTVGQAETYSDFSLPYFLFGLRDVDGDFNVAPGAVGLCNAFTTET